MKPSAPAFAPASTARIASAVVFSATVARTGTRPELTSRASLNMASFSSKLSAEFSPREPQTMRPSTPDSICHAKWARIPSMSSDKSRLNFVVTAGNTPAQDAFMTIPLLSSMAASALFTALACPKTWSLSASYVLRARSSSLSADALRDGARQ